MTIRTAALLALGLAAACNPLDFSSLADERWVDSTDAPDDVDADGYASAIGFAGSQGGGAAIMVVAGQPPFVVLLDYDAEGNVEKLSNDVREEFDSAQTLPERPAFATAPDEFGGSGASAFLGVTSGSSHYLLPIAGQTLDGAGAPIRLTDASGEAVAIAVGDVGGEAADEVIVLTEDRLYVFTDYDGAAPPPVVTCTLTGGLGVTTINGAIALAHDDGVSLFLGGEIVDMGVCPFDVPPLEGPSAEADFGSAMAAGDFDDDGDFDDLAMAAPSSNLVSVLVGGGEMTIEGPAGSDLFGTVLVAGDFDPSPGTELAVGDPGFDGHGAVHVYSGDGDLITTLHDIEPEDDQRFGQSLAVARFGGTDDILVVGADGEVFTYFRLTADGNDVRE